jgi:hypothetical protein
VRKVVDESFATVPANSSEAKLRFLAKEFKTGSLFGLACAPVGLQLGVLEIHGDKAGCCWGNKGRTRA